MNALQLPLNQPIQGQPGQLLAAPIEPNGVDNHGRVMAVIPLDALQQFQQYIVNVEQRIQGLEAANAALRTGQVEGLDPDLINTARRVDEQQIRIVELQEQLGEEQVRAQRIEARFDEVNQKNKELEELAQLRHVQMQEIAMNFEVNREERRQQRQDHENLLLQVRNLNVGLAVVRAHNNDLVEQNRHFEEQQAENQRRVLAEQELQQKRAGWIQDRNELLAKRKPFEEWHKNVYDSANAVAFGGAVLGANLGPLGSFFSGILAPVLGGVVIGANDNEILENGKKIQEIDDEIDRLDKLLGGDPTKLEPLYLAPISQIAKKLI